MKLFFSVILICLLLPATSFAAPGSDVFSLFTFFFQVIAKLQSLFWIFAVGLFFWGLVKFIYHSSDSAEHENGKQYMVWGIIVFFVLVSIWSIVALLSDSFNINPIGSLEYRGK